MATSSIVQREVRKRGFFGKLFKYLFIAFNVVMVIWLFSYWGTIGQHLDQATSNAARAGTSIGATIGTGFLVFFWLAGDVILGLFTMLTRGERILITEERS